MKVLFLCELICWSQHGAVDSPEVAKLLSSPPQQLGEELGAETRRQAGPRAGLAVGNAEKLFGKELKGPPGRLEVSMEGRGHALEATVSCPGTLGRSRNSRSGPVSLFLSDPQCGAVLLRAAGLEEGVGLGQQCHQVANTLFGTCLLKQTRYSGIHKARFLSWRNLGTDAERANLVVGGHLGCGQWSSIVHLPAACGPSL